MILDQNTIVLNPCNGFYDEYTLVGEKQVGIAASQDNPHVITTPICILPGAIVGQATIDPVYDAKKYPFFIQPGEGPEDGKARFEAKLAAAKEDGDEVLEAFYAKYPRQHVVTAGFTKATKVDDAAVLDTVTKDDLNAVEILILVENALLGKGIHSLYFPGEKTPVYSPVSGDRYLARCVPGTYTEGQPLYLCNYQDDTSDPRYKIRGYYFCGADYQGVKSEEIKAFAGEDYICPTATNENRKPFPFFLNVVDDSTTERPATKNINGCLTNLLRVRMA